ncbi:flavin reductase [Eubacteriales bacterium KG127]
MSDVIFKFSYGLFILTARDGQKDNGCIINTAMQATAEPFKVSMTLNKQNYTHDMIMNSKKFTVSFLSEDADFELFKTFGFSCGKDVDKFADFKDCERGENGVYYITRGTNAMVSVDVEQTLDIGTHTIFVGTVTEEKDLSDSASCTYNYYQNHVKPKPAAVKADDGVEKQVCTICNYIYDPTKGDPEHGIPAGTKFEDIPEDWVCPICKHGKEVFKVVE